jgi:NAD(P)-dependent dehydrogenase (short-subunit alcohol dehydrogenase family)
MNDNHSPEMSGRHVLVTGAGSGIGLATAIALHRHGARVAAVVQDASQSARVQAQLPQAAILVQDLLDDAGCAALPGQAAQALGGLDALACCAGIFFKRSSDETTLAEWRQTIELNLNSTFVLARSAIAQMRRANAPGASVLVVSSQLGQVGYARGAAYAASKAALNSLVKSLALEWAAQGVRVNALAPGPVETAMLAPTLADPAALAAMIQSIPMARIGRPEEIGEVASFLLSRRASFITGQVLCADGGFTAR